MLHVAHCTLRFAPVRRPGRAPHDSGFFRCQMTTPFVGLDVPTKPYISSVCSPPFASSEPRLQLELFTHRIVNCSEGDVSFSGFVDDTGQEHQILWTSSQ